MKLDSSFVNLQVGKENLQGTNRRRRMVEKNRGIIWSLLPPPFLFIPAPAPWAFSVLAFLWTRVLSYLTHAMGILGSSGREPCDLRSSEYVTRDAACHSIPLSLDQFRPQWLPSSTAPWVDYGRLYPGLYAHETHFQGERKASPFFLPSLFPFILLIRLLFLPGIFSLTISSNFSNTFILTKPQVHSSDHDTYWKEKKIPLVGYFVLPLFKSSSQLSSDSQDSVIYTYTLILQRTSRARINQEPSSTCKNNILIQSDSKPWNSQLINARSLEGRATAAGTMVKYLPWAHMRAPASPEDQGDGQE